MTPNKLPPLPEPKEAWLPTHTMEYYTADQMHAYGKLCSAEAFQLYVDANEARIDAEQALRQSQSLPAGAVADGPVFYVQRTYDCNAGEDRGEIIPTLPANLIGKRVRLVPVDEALQADAREKGEAVAYRYVADDGAYNPFVRDWLDGSPDQLDHDNIARHPGVRFEFAYANPAAAALATQPAQASEKDFVDIDACAMVSVMAAIEGRLKSEQGIPREQAHITRKEFNCLSRYMERYEHDTHPQPVTPAGGEVVLTGWTKADGKTRWMCHDGMPVFNDGKHDDLGTNKAIHLYTNPPVADAALALVPREPTEAMWTAMITASIEAEEIYDGQRPADVFDRFGKRRDRIIHQYRAAIKAALATQPAQASEKAAIDSSGIYSKSIGDDDWEISNLIWCGEQRRKATVAAHPAIPEGFCLVPKDALLTEARRLRYRMTETCGLGPARTDAGAQMIHTAEALEGFASSGQEKK